MTMSFHVTMEHASTLIANVTTGLIVRIVVMKETVIITILSDAHNTSALTEPASNIHSAVMVAEIAGMDQMSVTAHVGPTNSRVSMANAYQNR